MRQRWVLAALVMICACCSTLLARQGTVATKDNNSFDGDITEDSGAGTVTVVTHGISYTIKLANVQSIVYVDEVDRDVRNKAAALSPKDVKGRVALAQYALSHHALNTARDLALDAQKIEPSNPDARDVLERVKGQLRAQQPVVTNSPPPAATQPTTAPAPAPAVAVPAPSQTRNSPAAAPSGVATREVTADEMNFVRQSELRDGDNVRVKIDSDLRRRFAEYINMTPADFNKLPAMQQVFMILDRGRPDMRANVQILSDPSAMTSFRKNVEKTIVAGCLTSKCHGTTDTNFRLFSRENETGAYSNFLILQQYTGHVHGREVLMIDRQNPQQSMLLDYLLPPAITDNPHPEAKGYHGAVRNKSDPRYAQVMAWIRDDLKPVTPDYSRIDLSRPPTTQPAETAATR